MLSSNYLHTNHIYDIYMFKKDLVLNNNYKGCHAIKYTQTITYIYEREWNKSDRIYVEKGKQTKEIYLV